VASKELADGGDMYMELVLAVVGYGAPQAHANPTAQDLPGTWDDVAPGHVVLAQVALELLHRIDDRGLPIADLRVQAATRPTTSGTNAGTIPRT
jgi:hypothetical protein